MLGTNSSSVLFHGHSEGEYRGIGSNQLSVCSGIQSVRIIETSWRLPRNRCSTTVVWLEHTKSSTAFETDQDQIPSLSASVGDARAHDTSKHYLPIHGKLTTKR